MAQPIKKMETETQSPQPPLSGAADEYTLIGPNALTFPYPPPFPPPSFLSHFSPSERTLLRQHNVTAAAIADVRRHLRSIDRLPAEEGSASEIDMIKICLRLMHGNALAVFSTKRVSPNPSPPLCDDDVVVSPPVPPRNTLRTKKDNTAKKANPMDDPAKRAAIMGFTPSSPSSPADSAGPSTGISLTSQYNAMTIKRGKRTFPKACDGAAKCKNLLCEHKFAPVGALTQGSGLEARDPLIDPKVLKIVMDKSEQAGYMVSEGYAIKMLQKNEYKLVPAIKEIKADIDRREYALHHTGRVNIPYERFTTTAYSCPPRTSTTPNPHDCHTNGLPKCRDGFISGLENEDLHLAETLTQGWKSYYGKAILCARYRTKEQREAAFKVYIDEAKFRDERKAFWEEVQGQGLSSDEVEVCMEKWEEVNRIDGSSGFAGEGGENGKMRAVPWRKDAFASNKRTAAPGSALTSSTQPAASHVESPSFNAVPPKIKVYSHPLREAPVINDDPAPATPAKSSASTPSTPLAPIPEEDSEEKPTLANGKKLYEPEGGWHYRFSEENIRFVQQQEADKARYKELMDSVASDDVKITTLRLQANQLLHENRELQGMNWDLKFRATQRLLVEIDNPPEPQNIYDLVTKIADWDLKFSCALGEHDLPMLYSYELYDLLDKLCKNIYLVSVQTISEETRPAVRRAWEAINFGGRTFHQAMKLAVIIDRGLMEDTLGDKLAKATEMAMLLDETFKNLDIELPVLKRKDKRNRVEDKKLQGMLKQCLEFSMKVCEYPTDLSWHGITKLRREVGDGVFLQKQMETKYIGLVSCDPPTETMNKKNASTYLELIKKARAIDDLLKDKAENPVAKYEEMLKVWYVDKVHPVSILPGWKILIKDEETHNMIALLMLIAADEEEDKFGQVIQIFREAIHEDLLALHKFVKNDPKEFCAKTNYKFLVDVIGDPGQLKWENLTDEQIWDWILGFQIAKTRLGGDVREVLGWAVNFGGQHAAKKVVQPMHQGSSSTQRRIITPRRVQGSLHKALSKDAIEAKVGENETLEDAVERLGIDRNTGRLASRGTSSNAASDSATADVEDTSKTGSDVTEALDLLAKSDDPDVTEAMDILAQSDDPETTKALKEVYLHFFELGMAKAEAEARKDAAATDAALSDKAKGKQPAKG